MAIGWGVLGTGHQVRERILPGLTRAPDTRLAAICSRDASRAKDMAGRFGFARAYDSYEAMLRDDTVDVVYVCTPNILHAEQALQAVQAGKHVLEEKPMALARADAERLLEAAAARGVRLGLGYHLRHHPAHLEARRLVAEGRLGRVLMADLRWVSPGVRRPGWWWDPAMSGGADILMSRGIHLVELVCYLLDAEPESVSMVTDGQRPDRPLEDQLVATLRFAGDLFATVVVTRLGAAAPNSISLHGTAGFLQAVDTMNPKGSLQFATADAVAETTYQVKDLYQAEVEAFNRAVATGEPFGASGSDGLRAVRVTEALLESVRGGRSVPVG